MMYDLYTEEVLRYKESANKRHFSMDEIDDFHDEFMKNNGMSWEEFEEMFEEEGFEDSIELFNGN